MGKDLIGYDTLVERALRGVVREALRKAATGGWPGAHHAYITLRTDAPGVEIPDSLRARYPDELTIVLQHQFWGLEVEEDRFAVTLSFDKAGHRIEVPFAALTGYADPAVKFALQFRPAKRDGKAAADGKPAAPAGEPDSAAAPAAAPGEGGAEVVALDRFRKK